MINEGLDSSDADIGKIEIMKKFSFFEIEKGVEAPLIKALNGKNFDGIPLSLEVPESKPPENQFSKGRLSKQKESEKGNEKGNEKGWLSKRKEGGNRSDASGRRKRKKK
jgi:ATP-dependent RNA helicase DeaD